MKFDKAIKMFVYDLLGKDLAEKNNLCIVFKTSFGALINVFKG